MANFRYQVIDANGKMSEGIIEATSIGEASRKLKGDGKFIASLSLDKGGGIMNMEIGSPKLGTKDLVLISRQLASLLSAGITVVRSLDMLYQQLETKKAKKCIGEIYESVQSGRSLSEAFGEQKGVIPNIMISMISAGEESGRLDEVMERLAEHFAKEAKLKNKISSAMIYPKILAGLTFVIAVALLTFLVPKIGVTIAELGGELPALTKALLAISGSLVKYWYIYIAVAGLAVYGFKFWRSTDKGAETWSKIMLKMPVVGKATKMSASARFTRTVATLLKSGISVLQAVEITEKSLDNVILQKKLSLARVEIRKGTSLSRSIRDITEFPPMIYAMVSIGEESGTLDTILEKAADFFEDEADSATQKMVSALEPVMIIIMAIIVGLVVGGIAMPILTMAQWLL
ncbi:MAG: type II secretion system F family protein [Clostridiales bacterium]|jgi:type IV pilus assembly protein PilC|nr:type II secretion system F family protein [Clostridiales bacterium]